VAAVVLMQHLFQDLHYDVGYGAQWEKLGLLIDVFSHKLVD
jgi:hypothetical protein